MPRTVLDPSEDWSATSPVAIDRSSPGIAFTTPETSPSGSSMSPYYAIPVWDQVRLRRDIGRFYESARAAASPTPVVSMAPEEPIIVIFGRFPEIGDRRPDEKSTISISSIPEVIATIRAALSVQIKELAEMVGVERPTIYSWINETASPSKQNRRRLQQVYRLARRWEQISPAPIGQAIRDIGADGRSIVDLLSEEQLDETEIVRHFRTVAAAKEEIRRSRPRSFREIAEERGLDLTRMHEQRNVLDVITGKRFSAGE